MRRPTLARMIVATALAAVLAPPVVEASTYRWIHDGNGLWSHSQNWALLSGPLKAGFPDGPGDVAQFTGSYSGDIAIAVGVSGAVVDGILIRTNVAIDIRAGFPSARLIVFNGQAPAFVHLAGVNGGRSASISVAMELDAPLDVETDAATQLTRGAIRRFSPAGATLPPAPFEKHGPGEAIYTAPHSYGGSTTVHEGQLTLASGPGGAVPANLIIHDGIVRIAARSQIEGSASVTVNRGGRLEAREAGAFRELIVNEGVVLSQGATGLVSVDTIAMPGGAARRCRNEQVIPTRRAASA